MRAGRAAGLDLGLLFVSPQRTHGGLNQFKDARRRAIDDVDH